MLRINGITKSFGQRTLFADLHYQFPNAERIALVGANGAGKTTLLNIMCGLDSPDAGEILIPSEITVGYLPQKPNESPEETVLKECESGSKNLIQLRKIMDTALQRTDENAIHDYEHAESAFRLAGGYSLESRANLILKGLGFSPELVDKSPKSLSGGWRMRLELAKLFMSSPDFLILDEPTNHLDLPSLIWVENYLQQFRGTLLFVSHDRALLNRLSTITLHLNNAQLNAYRGNFDQFIVQREAQLEQDQSKKDQLRRKREAMEQFVERFGAKATKARQAQSRLKMIGKIRDLEEEISVDDSESHVFIDIPPPPSSPRIVLNVISGSIGYDRPLASGINMQVEKHAKIAVIGANGIGKSTLLRTIAGRLPSISGDFITGSGINCSYFAQDQSEILSTQKSVLENLLSLSPLSEKEARNLLGSFLFRGDDVHKKVKVLSGGEASRIGLACALAQRSALLLLDEPTNHLDMATVECLAASLGEWEGTVVFVSHDRTFIDGLATHIFAMLPDGRSHLFPGKLDDYAKLADLAGFPNVLAYDDDLLKSQKYAENPKSDRNTNQLDEEKIKNHKRRRQSIVKQIEKIDTDMGSLRAKINAKVAELDAMSHHDHKSTTAVYREKSALESQLNDLEIKWLELSEEVEAINTELIRCGRI